MGEKETPYIPALRFDFLTPLYDLVLRWGMRELTFKRRLIEQAQIAPGARVLDLGCGTATLTLLAKQIHPQAELVGIDGDERVLAIARAKAARQGRQIRLERGMAFQLPYPDRSFDRVLSSLVLHHLTTEDKARAIREAFRVLRAGGQFLVVDFGPPQNRLAELISLVMRRLEPVEDNIKGLLPTMFSRAGFQDVQVTAQCMTIFGTVALVEGIKRRRD